jgi:hypothetical protein
MCNDDMFDFEHPYTTLVRILHRNEMIRYGLSSFLCFRYANMPILHPEAKEVQGLEGVSTWYHMNRKELREQLTEHAGIKFAIDEG